jgi:hypothetical protein
MYFDPSVQRLHTITNFDHFVDIDEMVLDIVRTIEIDQFGLLDDHLKIAIISVAHT